MFKPKMFIDMLLEKHSSIKEEKLSAMKNDLDTIRTTYYGKHNKTVLKTMEDGFINTTNNIIHVTFMTLTMTLLTSLNNDNFKQLWDYANNIEGDDQTIKELVEFMNIYNGEVKNDTKKVETASISCGSDKECEEILNFRQKLHPKDVQINHEINGNFYSPHNTQLRTLYQEMLSPYETEVVYLLESCYKDMKKYGPINHKMGLSVEEQHLFDKYIDDMCNLPATVFNHIVSVQDKHVLFDDMPKRLKLYVMENKQLPERDDDIPIDPPVLRNNKRYKFKKYVNGELRESYIDVGTKFNMDVMKIITEHYCDSDIDYDIMHPTGNGNDNEFNIDNIMLMKQTGTIQKYKIKTDQYGVKWMVKPMTKLNQIKEIKKDIYMLRLLGISSKFTLPKAVKIFKYNPKTDRINTSRVMLFELGYQEPKLATVNKKAFPVSYPSCINVKYNDRVCEYYAGMGILMSYFGYNVHKLYLTQKGKLLFTEMDGKRNAPCNAKIGVNFTKQFLYTSSGDMLFLSDVIGRLVGSCTYKVKWKTGRQLFNQLRALAIDDLPDVISSLMEQASNYYDALNVVKYQVINEDGCQVIRSKDITSHDDYNPKECGYNVDEIKKLRNYEYNLAQINQRSDIEFDENYRHQYNLNHFPVSHHCELHDDINVEIDEFKSSVNDITNKIEHIREHNNINRSEILKQYNNHLEKLIREHSNRIQHTEYMNKMKQEQMENIVKKVLEYYTCNMNYQDVENNHQVKLDDIPIHSSTIHC